MTSYDFRIRGALWRTVKIESPITEVEIFAATPIRVLVKSSPSGTPLTDARDVVVHGSGYATAVAARADGLRWRGHTIIGFARPGIGVDFRERAPTGGMGAEHLAAVRAADQENQHYNEIPGVMIFQPLSGRYSIDSKPAPS